MKYVHVANAVSSEQSYHSCEVAKNIQEATALIEAGLEYVTEMDGVRMFRKRK